MIKLKVLGLILTVSMFSAPVIHAETINHTFDADDFQRVEVETFNGSITASVTSGDEISLSFDQGVSEDVVGDLSESLSGLLDLASSLDPSQGLDIDIDEDKSAGVLRIEAEMPEGDHSVTGCNVTLSLPSDIFVELTSLNGAVKVDGHQNGFDLKTTNGPIVIKNTAGKGEFDATNGNVTVDNHRGNISGESTNGMITANVVMPDQDGICKLETVNNDIILSVPSSVGAKVRLSTVHGSTSIQDLDYSKTKGTIGDGSGTISLETTNGDLTLKEME